MRILFLPFVVPGAGGGDPAQGALTRALARELSVRVGQAEGVEAAFRPFTHMVEGKRLFGVYGRRWSVEDLSRLLADGPEADLVVHGDMDVTDPVRLAVEVLRAPELLPVGEETFEAPRFDGFAAIEGAARFVLGAAGLPDDAPSLSEFPARSFEAFVHLLRGREAVAGLDGWGDPEDPAAAYEPFLEALHIEPGMSAAREEICLLASAAAAGGLTPLDAAESAVRRLLEVDGKYWRAWATLGQVRGTAGDLPEAEKAFLAALEIEPGRASLRYDLGITYLRQARASKAAKTLETVRSDPRVGPDALFQLGTIRAGKGDIEGAVTLWRESAEKDPDRALVWGNLGRALASRGDFDEAEEAFRRGLQAERSSWFLHLAYGSHLLDQSRYQNAVRELREVLRLRAGEPEAHLLLGRSLAAEGEKRLAIQHLRKALRAGGAHAERAREAIEDFASAEREDRMIEMLDDALARPAEEQIVLLKSLLKEEAAYAEARVRLGIALAAEGKPRAAEGQFRKALKILPDDPEAWSGLATALRARKKLKAAEGAHRETLARAPGHAAYHLNLADTLLRLGRVQEAARAVEEARSLEPHHPLLASFVRSVKLFLSQNQLSGTTDPDKPGQFAG